VKRNGFVFFFLFYKRNEIPHLTCPQTSTNSTPMSIVSKLFALFACGFLICDIGFQKRKKKRVWVGLVRAGIDFPFFVGHPFDGLFFMPSGWFLFVTPLHKQQPTTDARSTERFSHWQTRQKIAPRLCTFGFVAQSSFFHGKTSARIFVGRPIDRPIDRQTERRIDREAHRQVSSLYRIWRWRKALKQTTCQDGASLHVLFFQMPAADSIFTWAAANTFVPISAVPYSGTVPTALSRKSRNPALQANVVL